MSLPSVFRRSIPFLLLLASLTATAQGPSPAGLQAYKRLITQGPALTKTGLSSDFLIYLESYRLFMYTALHGEDSSYEAFLEGSERLEEELSDKDGPWSVYYRAEMLLQQAFIELKAENELSGAWKLRQAYKIAEKGVANFPEFSPLLKTLGVMQCIIGAVPDNMKWVPSMFGMEGALHEGIKNIKKAAKQTSWLHTEAELLLALCNSYLLGENKSASASMDAMTTGKPGALQSYLAMNIYLRSHDAQKALRVYEKTAMEDRRRIPQLHYLAGISMVQTGEYESGIQEFQTFRVRHTSEDFLKDSWYRSGLAHLLQGDSSTALLDFNKAANTGNLSTEADRYADKHSRMPLPNPLIMKLRLFSDGGLYAKASDISRQIDPDQFLTALEKTEFIYRTARLAHLTGDTIKAVSLYHKTILRQGDERWYFAPNSLLQLGYLHLASNPDLSREYFTRIKSYTGYEYEKGIERKAQAALNNYF